MSPIGRLLVVHLHHHYDRGWTMHNLDWWIIGILTRDEIKRIKCSCKVEIKIRNSAPLIRSCIKDKFIQDDEAAQTDLPMKLHGRARTEEISRRRWSITPLPTIHHHHHQSPDVFLDSMLYHGKSLQMLHALRTRCMKLWAFRFQSRWDEIQSILASSLGMCYQAFYQVFWLMIDLNHLTKDVVPFQTEMRNS